MCLKYIYRTSDVIIDIDTDLCTHIIFHSMDVDPEKFTLRFYESWTGFNQKYGQQVKAYKALGIKVMVLLENRVPFVTIDAARAIFVNQMINFLLEHNLDGLDIWLVHIRDRCPNWP